MSAVEILLVVWVAAALGMGAAYVYARARRNMGYVDVFWALGMALAAITVGLLAGGDPLVRLLVAALGGLWGLRLFRFLWQRVRGEAEDGRYRAMREAIGDGGPRWFAFFQLQALVIALFALPFIAAASAPGGFDSPWHLSPRTVGVVAASELLLRMAALVRLCGARRRRPAVVAGMARSVADVRLPVAGQRYPVDRGTGAAQPRRRLPPLPVRGHCVLSLATRARCGTRHHRLNPRNPT